MQLSLLYALDVVLLVRGFYIFCSAAILIARTVPFLQSRYLAYGARAQGQRTVSHGQPASSSFVSVSQWLDYLARIHVPHSWFRHFYLVSISSTLAWLTILYFWQCQLNKPGLLLPQDRPAQSRGSVYTCLLLLLVHGLRRLYECLILMKSSSSNMWIGHYIFGLTFYLVTNVAVWAESLGGTCIDRVSMWESIANSLSPGACLGATIFLLASLGQHLVHRHLAGLKKYSVPRGIPFTMLIAPHYTAECALYLSMALVAAPHGQFFNYTLICTVLLTIINLGITAEGTKQWMLSKFQDDRHEIARRFCLIPGIW